MNRTAEKLKDLGFTQTEIGEVLGLSQPSVHRKLHGLTEWTRSEINLVLDLVRKRDSKVTFESLFGNHQSAA